MTTLVQHLSVTESNVSVNVNRLVAAGLVTRRRSQHDLRAVELYVTSKGREVESRVWSRVGQLVAEAAEDLPRADVATAARVFWELAQRLNPGHAPERDAS